MFENAKWITRKPWIVWRIIPEWELSHAPYLVKSFDVAKKVSSAVLNIVGYGQGAYFINGKRIVDSYLPTVFSLTEKTVVYNSYDITEEIIAGKNKIGVILGNNFQGSGQNAYKSFVKMIAQLDITYSDGTACTYVSDTSWKTADSPILYDARRVGEKFDARLKTDGWSNPEFDDTFWDNAVICKGAGGKFRQSIVEPIRIIKEIDGVELKNRIFDFKSNVSGWVKINVRGKSGSETVIKYSELLNDDGSALDRTSSCQGEGNHKDVYILSGESNGEIWEQSFLYHGFRYVQIEGDCEILSVKAVVAYTDMPQVSDFACDNEVINLIHRACVNSLKTNCHGLMTDCPHREQNFWTGDALFSAESITLSFDAYRMLSEWAEHFDDTQLCDGQLPSIVPPFDRAWEYNFANGPDWDSALIHLPYYAFKYSGNRAIVDRLWNNMDLLLDYFAARSENSILNFGLGDWGTFEEEGCPVEISDTCFYRIDALMMSEMATATSRNPQKYDLLAQKIKSEFRGKYIKDGKLLSNSDTAVAMCLLAKMYEPFEAQAEADRLANNIIAKGKRICCGTHGVRSVFDMLSEYGYTQLAFDVTVNDKYPGYAATVKDGFDTLPEFFDYKNRSHTPSFNHHFLSHIDAWLYKSLAGIKVNGIGYDDVVIEPTFVDGISCLKAETHGIKVEYNEKEITVNCPYPFTVKLAGCVKKSAPGKYKFSR